MADLDDPWFAKLGEIVAAQRALSVRADTIQHAFNAHVELALHAKRCRACGEAPCESAQAIARRRDALVVAATDAPRG
jgi:hypothetical protein